MAATHVEIDRRNAFLAVATRRMDNLCETEIAAFGGRIRRVALLRAVAVEFGLSQADLTGRSHRADKTRGRFAFVRLARVRLQASYPDISRTLGGRDHTTAIHAFRRAADLMTSDPDFAARSARIEARLWPTNEAERYQACVG